MKRVRFHSHTQGASKGEPKTLCGIYVEDLFAALVPPEQATCERCRRGMVMGPARQEVRP